MDQLGLHEKGLKKKYTLYRLRQGVYFCLNDNQARSKAFGSALNEKLGEYRCLYLFRIMLTI